MQKTEIILVPLEYRPFNFEKQPDLKTNLNSKPAWSLRPPGEPIGLDEYFIGYYKTSSFAEKKMYRCKFLRNGN